MMVFLIVWTVLAFTWWGIALWLLADARRWQHVPAPSQRPSITLFKSLPPVHDERELAALAAAIESFARELSSQDELLIGINTLDAARWQTAEKRWRSAGKQARIETVVQSMPTQCANPKIAWQQVLAEKAKGELWLWSDADVTVRAGFLDAFAAQLTGSSGCHAVTAPYCIREIRSRQGAFDALFVNVEFLPGTLLLGRLNRKNFAYGAATLFRAETFRQRVDWRELGAALADDHKLGKLLQPVLLAHTVVSTFTQPPSWSAAWQHYYRWQKTVRWCQPGGFAALLMLMPAFGWSVGGLALSCQMQVAGLGTVLIGEMLVGLVACRMVGCRMPGSALPGVWLWPLARPLAWLLVWLPLPVHWSGRQQKWFAPVDQ